MNSLITIAAEVFGVPAEALIQRDRRREVAQPRQAVMYVLARQNIGYAEIGRRLGGKNHTTIIYGVQAAEQRAVADADYALKLSALME